MLQSSELSRCDQQITFKLIRCYKRDKGFFSKFGGQPYDFQMVIKTEPLKWEVDRSFIQLMYLRQALLLQHPDTIVPALPNLDPKKFLNEYDQERTAKMVVKFLEACCMSPSLR